MDKHAGICKRDGGKETLNRKEDLNDPLIFATSTPYIVKLKTKYGGINYGIIIIISTNYIYRYGNFRDDRSLITVYYLFLNFPGRDIL